jgi:hypothetical protein
MDEPWTPTLRLWEHAGRCRLTLDGITCGEGTTLQEAGDELVSRLLEIALSARRSGFHVPAELGPPDVRVLAFLHELGEIAARGGDIHDRVFGSYDDTELAA